MGDTLSVVVQIDLHGTSVRLVVTGTVTDTTQRALYPLMARARTVVPGASVSVDLTGAENVEPTAIGLLQAALEHHHPESGDGSVEILAPTECSSSLLRAAGPWYGPAVLGAESRYPRFHHPPASSVRPVPVPAPEPAVGGRDVHR